jgi:hypothetical protein
MERTQKTLKWEEIYENYDLFEGVLSWTCVPVNRRLFDDDEMKLKMWMDLCSQWRLAKRHVERVYNTTGHPSDLYKEYDTYNNEL